jgi:FAD/FMN-containing dehydrogenase
LVESQSPAGARRIAGQRHFLTLPQEYHVLDALRHVGKRYCKSVIASSVPAAPYLEDASGYHGEAEQAFTPSDVQQLREIVLAASSNKTPLTVSGAGTGLTGARVPHGGWIVSMERFRRLEIQSGRAVCGAAISLQELTQAANQTGQFFGPNPTEYSASIGGIVATNAGGARGFRFGSVRRHVLSLEVTFMDGRTVHFRRGEHVNFPIRSIRRPATTKNSAGYFLEPGVQWVDLLAGSEGTLGIITEAELQLLPVPPAILGGVVFFPSDEDALNAVDAWRTVPALRLLEYMDGPSLDLLRPIHTNIPAKAQGALLIEQDLPSQNDEEVDRWVERLADHHAFENESWFGFSMAERDRFAELRHSLPAMIVDRVRRNGWPKFGSDFAVPVDRSRDLLAYYRLRGDEVLPGQYVIFGHIGDANVHVNLLPATAAQAKLGEELMTDFARYAVLLGGTVAAEHGIGKTKVDLLKLMYGESEIEAMRDVKRHLDPDCLLGRGTIFAA